MKSKIDLETWARAQHFKHFLDYDEPFHGIMVDVNMDQALKYTQENSLPLFNYYMHKYILAINDTYAMRLRIINREVYLYDWIDAATTILRKDKTYALARFPFHRDFDTFSDLMINEIAKTKVRKELFGPNREINMTHGSVMPWINFTGLSHARKYSNDDSAPKITFGKIHKKEGRSMMPMSVHVHHSLVDGIDVAEFIENFQNNLDQK